MTATAILGPILLGTAICWGIVILVGFLANVFVDFIDIARFGNRSSTRNLYLVRWTVPGRAPVCIRQNNFTLAECLAFQVATSFDVTVRIFKNGEVVYTYYATADEAMSER